jgi:hypothetical protein
VVSFSDLISGPKMFRETLGPRWGPRWWRVFFVIVVLGIAAVAAQEIGSVGSRTIAATRELFSPRPPPTAGTIIRMGLRSYGPNNLTPAGVSPGFMHEESFNDGTVAVEFEQTADPQTLKVRREHTTDYFEIVERQPHKVRFKVGPVALNDVVVIIIEGVFSP